MEDVHVKEWSEFFADAGLSKTDRTQYALSFTNNDVEMQSFCELVSQHTESGITFMKSLGVNPAGHQIKISMKARNYRNTSHIVPPVEFTFQSNFKTEKLETNCHPSLKVESIEEIIEVSPNNNINTSPTTKHSLTRILQLSPPNSVLNPFFANRIPASSPPSTINISTEGSHSQQSPLQIKSEHFYISVTPDHTLSDLSLPQPEPHLLLENTRRWVEESMSYADTLTNTDAEEYKAAKNKLETLVFQGEEKSCAYSAFGENGIENRANKGVDDINPTMLRVSGFLDGFSKPHFREVFPTAVEVCLKKRTNIDGDNYFHVHIQFSTPADAEKAFDAAQNLTIANHNMKVVFARKDKNSEAMNCAVVTFSNPAEAKVAVEALQVTELGGSLSPSVQPGQDIINEERAATMGAKRLLNVCVFQNGTLSKCTGMWFKYKPSNSLLPSPLNHLKQHRKLSMQSMERGFAEEKFSAMQAFLVDMVLGFG